MSNQRLMKAKEKAGDGYAKTNAIAPPPIPPRTLTVNQGDPYARITGGLRVAQLLVTVFVVLRHGPH